MAVALPRPPLLGWQVPDATRPPVVAGVVRDRIGLLLDALLAPDPERRVGLVVAPAGSGKTTAVAHWASRRASTTAWLRVPAASRPGQLSGQARAAVAAHGPRCSADPLVLVLDDLQHLSGPQAGCELEELVLTAPPDVALLLLSRAPLPCDFARAELPQPLRVGREELGLLPHELQAAVEQAGAGRLPAAVAVVLAQRTDGWPAAVPLLAQAGQAGLRTLAARVGPEGLPWAADYLERQVLTGLSTDLRELLVRCSPLPVLDGPRCDAVTGRSDGAEALRELARQGVVEPVPGAPAAYRCHPVLRAHLRDQRGAGAPLPLTLTATDRPVGRDELLPLLLQGDHRAAAELAERLPAQSCLHGRTALHVLRGLLDDAPDALAALVGLPSGAGSEVHRRVVAGAAALLDGACGFALELADDLDREDEPAAALALRAAVSVARWRAGTPDLVLLERAVGDARRVHDRHGPAPEAWARALHALAAAHAQLPEADREAAAAEAVARRAGLPAAGAVACAALALTRPEHAAELLRLAEDEAAAAGLRCRPWEWAPQPAPPLQVAGAVEPSVRVTCFGGFHLQVDGQAPDLSALRPRARTLLRLLALHGGLPVHREELVDALWGDLPARAGLHNLQVAVSSLRHALEPDRPARGSVLLPRHGEAYALELGGGGTDLQDFDAALAAAEQADDAEAHGLLQAALALYRGDVLSEDGPADWVVEVRERYRLRAAEAAGRLAALRLGAGDAPGAVTAALRSVELDRYRDASWRLLVQASTRAGDLAQAARAHRAYLVLLDELGLSAEAAELPDAPQTVAAHTAAAPDQRRARNSTSPRATRPPRRSP